MNKRWAALTTIILLCLAAAVAPAALDVTLEYVPCSMETGPPLPNMDYWPGGSADIEKIEAAPPGDWKLPKFTSNKPVFGLLRLRDDTFLFAADMEHKRDKFYNVLYFDVNRNGDLTDNGVLRSREFYVTDDDRYRRVEFPAVDVKLAHADAELPYRTSVQMSAYDTNEVTGSGPEAWWPNLHVSCNLSCMYKGSFQLDSKEYTVVLSDTNVNGRFDDRAALADARQPDRVLYPHGDVVTLWQNGSGQYYDEITLPRYLWVGGGLYDVLIDTAHNRMTLTPVTDNLATLDIPENVERLLIGTDGIETSVAAFRPGTSMQVPPGRYRLLACQFYRRDPQGDRWRLNARGTVNTPWIGVAAGEYARMAFGEPFRPLVRVPSWAADRRRQSGADDVLIEFLITGSANEQVTDLAHVDGHKTKIALSKSDGGRPKEPKYKIIKPDGETVVQGKFEYG